MADDTMTLVIAVPADRTPMFAACGADNCDHLWVAAWLPMEMSLAARVLQSLRCPLCGHESPRCASAETSDKIRVIQPNPRCADCGQSSVEHLLGVACKRFTRERSDG